MSETNYLDPLSENTGARKEKNAKITNLTNMTEKMSNFRVIFHIINPLKVNNTRNLAKNYNFPVIFFQFIGFFRVKKAFFGGLGPYIGEYSII